MEMKKYIEMGEAKAGKQKDLAEILGIKDNHLRNAKGGRSGLPVEICIQLADFIGVERLEVIAASNLVTEKDERKRKILESCFTSAATIAAATIIIGASSITSTPANAGLLTDSNAKEFILC